VHGSPIFAVPAVTHAVLPDASAISHVSASVHPHCGTIPHVLVGVVGVHAGPVSGAAASPGGGGIGPLSVVFAGGGAGGFAPSSPPAGVVPFVSSKEPRPVPFAAQATTTNDASTQIKRFVIKQASRAVLPLELGC
jgi:hypothetical protein